MLQKNTAAEGGNAVSEEVENKASESEVPETTGAEQSAENQKAPETEEEAIAEAKRKVVSFDAKALVLDDEGEINKAINVLYDLCVKNNIPMVMGLTYKVDPDEEGFNTEIRGIQTVGENNFLPPSLRAMILVMESSGLSSMVANVASSPMMGLLDVMNSSKD